MLYEKGNNNRSDDAAVRDGTECLHGLKERG